MEVLLNKVTQQTVNFVIRSGISVTASYAISQSSRLLRNVDDNEDRRELLDLQRRLDKKIQIISPSIDMIEMIAARGNTSLESAVTLTKDIRKDIQSLGSRIEKAAASEELTRKGAQPSKNRAQNDAEIKRIIKDIKALLNRIEDAVPLMSLAITTSGAKLSTSLPSTVSPSRLLQASTFLSAGDTRYSVLPSQAVQIGPTFTLSMYMLFASHVRPHDEEGIRETTWKEVMHKSRLKLRRVPMDSPFSPDGQGRRIPAEAKANEFAYQLLIVEDLDDGRVHTFEGSEQQPGSYGDVAVAGMREIVPVHQISKIFYADTGKLLNINPERESNNPVLLLKRDINAIPPRRMMEREETAYNDPEPGPEQDYADEEVQAQLDAQLNAASAQGDTHSYYEDSIPKEWRVPQGLDPEWIAFEVYNEDEQSSDTESEAELSNSPSKPGTHTIDPDRMAKLSLDPNDQRSPSRSQELAYYGYDMPQSQAGTAVNPVFINVRTSLSLLETLLRLTSLQQFQQQSHLSISDELLNFFLEESSTTGAGGDEQHRQRIRAAARGKVGFDPFDESPIKRRGEDHMYSGTPGSTPLRDDVYSPTASNIPHARSRESTPVTPWPSRESPSARSSSGQRVRGSSSYTEEALKRGSPLAKGSTTARSEDVVPSKEGSGPDTQRSDAAAKSKRTTKGN